MLFRVQKGIALIYKGYAERHIIHQIINEFIACFHESWIYESRICSSKFAIFFGSAQNGFLFFSEKTEMFQLCWKKSIRNRQLKTYLCIPILRILNSQIPNRQTSSSSNATFSLSTNWTSFSLWFVIYNIVWNIIPTNQTCKTFSNGPSTLWKFGFIESKLIVGLAFIKYLRSPLELKSGEKKVTDSDRQIRLENCLIPWIYHLY